MIVFPIIPFAAFWVLILLGRSDLGIKAILICVAIWAGLLYAFLSFEMLAYFCVLVQAVFDIILILIIFGGDIRIG